MSANVETTSDLVALDRMALEETLTRDLVGRLWRANLPHLAAMGMAHMRPPKLRLGRAPSEDADAHIERVSQMRRAGLPVVADEAYRNTGFTRPAGTPAVLDFQS